jgi:hypothetical protein
VDIIWVKGERGGAGEWKELHNEELNDTYLLPRIVRVIKPRIMIQAWHVARMEERRGAYSVLAGNLREKDHLEDSGLEGRIVK